MKYLFFIIFSLININLFSSGNRNIDLIYEPSLSKYQKIEIQLGPKYNKNSIYYIKSTVQYIENYNNEDE